MEAYLTLKSESCLESESFHVVRTRDDIDLTIYLRALVLPDPTLDDSYCDEVDIATTISMRSKVGFVPTDPIDKQLIDKSGIDVQNSIYTRCALASCRLNPDHPALAGDEQIERSKVTVQLKAG